MASVALMFLWNLTLSCLTGTGKPLLLCSGMTWVGILICASAFDIGSDSVLSPSFAWICSMSSAVYVFGMSCFSCRVSPCVVTVQEEVLTPSTSFDWKRFSSHLYTAAIDVVVNFGPPLMLEAFPVLLDYFFRFQFAVLVVCVGAAHWKDGEMEADVPPSADQRYGLKEETKNFLQVLQHAVIFGHSPLITGLAAVVTAAVVTAAAWWVADQKYMVVAAAACRVAFLLPVVPEFFFGFDVVSYGIEDATVSDCGDEVVLAGCFRVLAVRFFTLVAGCFDMSEIDGFIDPGFVVLSVEHFCVSIAAAALMLVACVGCVATAALHASASSLFLTLVVDDTEAAEADGVKGETDRSPFPSGNSWTESGGLPGPGPGENFQMLEEGKEYGDGEGKGGKEELLNSYFVFVSSLSGSTVQIRVESTDSYESLAEKVVAKTLIPEPHWYLTYSGSDLRHVPCLFSVLQRDSTVRMQSRLLGGAPLQPTPGEWFCPGCNRGGCWASRRNCFRCLAPRPSDDSASLQPQSRGRNQRERRALGREPQRSSNQCPTERRNPAPSNVARGSDAGSPPRQPQSSASLDASSVIALLKGLNVPAEIVEMVSNKLIPAPPDPKPEKLLLDMRNKLDSLEKEYARLQGVVQTKTNELHAASERADSKAYEVHLAQLEYHELKERIDKPVVVEVDPEESMEQPPPLPPPPTVPNPADIICGLDDQESDMDLDNPGVEEEEDGQAPMSKRKRLNHFDQMMAGLAHFDNEMLAKFLGHVQEFSAQQSAISQENGMLSCG